MMTFLPLSSGAQSLALLTPPMRGHRAPLLKGLA